jgi:general secretion pathway protein C
MTISQRHLLWVNLVLLALVAYWGASTVSTAIAAKLTPSPEIHLSPPPPPIAHEPRRPASYYAAIHTRDIFNSTKPEVEKPPEPPKPTQLNLKLWGTSVHTGGASHCIIEDLATHKQELYGIKDKVAGTATVKLIEWDRVTLDRDGQEEILELALPAGGGLPARPVAAVVSGRAGGQPAPGQPAPGQPVAGQPATGQPAPNPHIQQVNENQYSIDRSEVEAALDNMSQLFTQIRAVPHFEGGQSTGFRLFAIRQNSIFDQIGLRNGDIIQNINGNEINDPGKAMGLFQDLRNAQQLTVGLMRNKQNMTMTYRIN